MKKLIIILLLLIVFFIGACTSEQPEVKGPFLGGTKAISINFVDNAPPSQINQGESVPVKVLLKNEGEYSLRAGDAKVKLYGLSLEQYGLYGTFIATSGNLMGKSENLLEGGEQGIDFPNLKYTEEVHRSITPILRAKVCYPYQTEARIKVCMTSTSIKEGGEERLCDENGEKVVAGSVSSAPIQVTSLTEELYGSDMIKFKILIKNQGTGDVHLKDYSCEEIDDDRLKGKDKVELSIDDPEIKCTFRDGTISNKGEITLDNKPIVCKKTVVESHEDVLIIRLNYKYVDRVQKEIEIVEV